MKLFTIAATLSFAISASHIADAMIGAPVVMGGMIYPGLALPTLANLILGVLFATWGLYGLAGAGRISALPFLSATLHGVGGLYLLRGLFLIPQLLGHNIFSLRMDVTAHDLLVSAVSLLVGSIHLIALERRAQSDRKRRISSSILSRPSAAEAHRDARATRTSHCG